MSEPLLVASGLSLLAAALHGILGETAIFHQARANPSVAAFYRHTVRQWHRYLSRRSQRSYLRWEKFEQILARYPLVRPTLPHSIYVPVREGP